MSTRCTITVADQHGAYTLYRHSDGYPDGPHGVLATIAQAFPLAWPWPRFEASDFSAALVSAWKTQGGNTRLSTGREESGDTDFHYEVTATGPAYRHDTLMVQVFERRATYGTWAKMGTPHDITPQIDNKES